MRLRYEAFSTFSSALFLCKSTEGVQCCLQHHLKYILDYEHFRIRVDLEGRDLTLIIPKHSDAVDVLSLEETVYEKNVSDTGIPKMYGYNELFKLQGTKEQINPTNELWCWQFFHNDQMVTVQTTSVCDANATYNKTDVSFIRLVTETVIIKLKEIELIQQLRQLNENQAKVIQQKTEELEERHQAFMRLAMNQSHDIREPLTRILALISMMDMEMEEEVQSRANSYIKRSAEDLDRAIRRTVYTIEAEMSKGETKDGE